MINLDLKKAQRYILYIIIFEAILGGAGRIVAIHNISLRMILYCIAFVIFIANFVNQKKNGFTKLKVVDMKSKLLIIFGIWIAIAALNGFFISRNNLSQIIGDLTGYTSLVLMIIFSYEFDTKMKIEFISKIITVSVVIQAVIILLLHYALGLKIVSFENLNALLQNYYLGNLSYIVPNSIRIFLKGAIYLQIGFVFLVAYLSKKNSKRDRIILYASLIIVSYAIILTFTRGFWIAAFVDVVIYVLLKHAKNIVKTIAITLIGLIVLISISYLSYGNNSISYSIIARIGINLNNTSLGTKNNESNIIPGVSDGQDLSVDYRQKLKKAMFSRIKSSPLIGKGFGVLLTEIGQKESRCEYMFYDMWMEMGIVGLIIYFAIFVLIIKQWIKIKISLKSSEQSYLLDAFVISMIGVIITSAINPYLNNPIGITYLLIVICVINVFRKESING